MSGRYRPTGTNRDFSRLQKVYIESRHEEGKHPNGYISDIDHDSEKIYVTFTDKNMDVYDFDQFEGNWTDKFGGCWMVKKGRFD